MQKNNSLDEFYIRRCIELAKNGLGTTYPNPLVGSVIVHNGKIIGEGWHQKAGEAHAEVHAVHSVKDKTLLPEATIYVSLEPCSHFGKTPPCCDLILAHKIPNVVIGTPDPFAKVSGNGIRKLQEAGTNVTVGVLENECNELNKRFFTFHTKKRPYIILKWAQTSDGYIAPAVREAQKPVWITNTYSRQLVHKWRSEEQAILVGTQTVVDDNPTLNVRDWTGNNPVRIVLDKNNRISKESFIFDSSSKTVLIDNQVIDFDKNPATQIAGYLYKEGIQSVIIEGGRQTLQTFIDAGLWDEARVFFGEASFSEGTKAPVITGQAVQKSKIGSDELVIYSNL
ncbi:bifunctional diaminohydroxyphosphoribosylaminopyrimidine deaminase/5-amino-6-(5-phosphoribosylamino)uracil reductase RibD [Flavobacterium humi]|uniref:Riboflavin biosynthesis protein RibD n=1 Tax=Flavobacterium humi TaxID=2562683 RepID=A0A4Z0L5H3_9FLAO|nr:bifunctional diaminohydroxyphosphoribosylaminopyrimidine deaminase/5-amino-6-(5-phosphoribosylamino)uracil reductase RibD [Flavobacterium humi]TGD56812.1 bifunctional diaminohydroxyphosphoribosylaminopyrimidine deaminase/5-amino-6-(5-phosphoribosylamino)uracil reductase RibD [Flavobacterium humi]